MDKEKFVELINKLSLEACLHGGDAGGPYYSNANGLLESLVKIKEYFELDEYNIGIITRPGWYSYGFVKIKEE